MNRATWVLVAIVLVGAAGALFLLREERAPEPAPAEELVGKELSPAEDAMPPSAAAAPSAEEEPVVVSETEPPVPTVPIEPVEPESSRPDLDGSDAATRAALVEVLGERPVESFLVPDQVVRKIVVTVDNLPNEKVAMRLRAIKALPGRFAASGSVDDGYTLGRDNYPRYAAFVRLVEELDARQMAALYFRYYPLLQAAYEELGYGSLQFHARVIAAIDDLLAAPEVDPPIALVRPKVNYEFADPDLEARSAGQKIMIRMGSDNAYLVKTKLRELRTVLTEPQTGP